MKKLNSRELAGHINRAGAVYVFVQYAPEAGCYIEIAKTAAREIVADMRSPGEMVPVVWVDLDGGKADGTGASLYIGGEEIFEAEIPALAGGSPADEEEEEAEDEEEEDDEGEEDEELEEEAAEEGSEAHEGDSD
jgi:hypothetical protein